MRLLSILLLVALCRCSCPEPAPDAGAVSDAGSAADRASVDRGSLDLASLDRSSLDSQVQDVAPTDTSQRDGAIDGAAADAASRDHSAFDSSAGIDAASAYQGPCNDWLGGSYGDAVRAAGQVAGGTVIGLDEPAETLTLAPGQTLSGPLYVFNDAALVVTGTAGNPSSIAGEVFLFDRGQLVVSGAVLHVAQSSAAFFPVYLADDSRYLATDATVSLGELANNLQTMFVCGRSGVTLRHVHYGTASKPAPFVMDDANFTVEQLQSGLVELTLRQGRARATLRDNTAATVGLYFAATDPSPTRLTLPSGLVAARTIALLGPGGGPGVSADITNSNVFFGLWVEPATAVTLDQSDLGLFLTVRDDVTIDGLARGSGTETRRLPLPDRTLDLATTHLAVLNLYYEPASARTLNLLRSTVGELACRGPAGTRCLLQESTVDGSGGFISVTDHAELLLDHATVTTYIQATQHGVARLRLSVMAASSSQPLVWISAADDALVWLENSEPFMTGGPGNGLPNLLVTGNGAVASAAIFLPLAGNVITRPATLAVSGIARVVAASSVNSFASYELALVSRANGAVAVVATSSAPVASALLGTIDSSSLAPGLYDLQLTITLQSGASSELRHELQVN